MLKRGDLVALKRDISQAMMTKFSVGHWEASSRFKRNEVGLVIETTSAAARIVIEVSRVGWVSEWVLMKVG